MNSSHQPKLACTSRGLTNMSTESVAIVRFPMFRLLRRVAAHLGTLHPASVALAGRELPGAPCAATIYDNKLAIRILVYSASL